MRYETPEITVVGQAEDVILGERLDPEPESFVSTRRGELIGYEE